LKGGYAAYSGLPQPETELDFRQTIIGCNYKGIFMNLLLLMTWLYLRHHGMRCNVC
jgi:hypothetical protein